jgi:hypothetical protein
MADNSERILILSTILLLLIIVQSINYSPPRRIGTLKDIDVDICTPQDNYTLGEGFTATVYLVNAESEDIWIEGFYQYAINRYSLGHPEEGKIADVQVQFDKENPWIHVPANSKTKFENIYCMPKYSGEFRIICLGAKKTVLILEYGCAEANNDNESRYVDIGILDLKVQPDKDEYYLREPALVSIYLVNPYPYRVIVEDVVGYDFSGEAEFQIGAIVGFHEFNPERGPITIGPHSELFIGTETMPPWRTGNFTFHAGVKNLRASYTVKVYLWPDVQLDNENMLRQIIVNATDMSEEDNVEYVAVSPSDYGKVNVTIEFGEIVSGKDAKMGMGKEFKGEMTAYVRYFNVTRYGYGIHTGQIIGERYGWIDMMGRCYVYDGWDLL